MKCPNCSAENASGNFCTECGAELDVSCPSCGEAVPAGARFCTACGEPMAGATRRGGGSRAPWIIGAAAAIVVLLIVFLPGDTEPVRPTGGMGAPAGAPAGGMGGAGGGMGGGMGGLSGDMRTNADRLFNRIMTAAERGDRAEVVQFMPMAIQAYGLVENLDDDGLYHLALLQRTSGQLDQAIRTAETILEDSPNHILALGVAAEAAMQAGDEAAARGYWERLLAAYPEEAARPLPEYMDHQNMLTEYRGLAERATESAGD